jgi:hypothetical protein
MANISDFLEDNLSESNIKIESSNSSMPTSTFTKQTCPITRALQGLAKTGAHYTNNDALVVVGGEEIIMDSAEYYASIDAIEMSLLEAKYSNAPADEQAAAIARTKERIFAEFNGGDLIDAYDRLFTRVLPNSYLLAEQLSRVVVLLRTICIKLELEGADVKQFEMIKNYDYVLTRRPDVLKDELIELLNFTMKLNIKNNLKEDRYLDVDFPRFDCPEFPQNEQIIDANTIEEMKALYEQKKKVLEYMEKVEKIHTVVIKFLEEVIAELMKKLH